MAVVEAVREAVGNRGRDITAVGLSGQMHGVVLTDEAGASSEAPPVLWADIRSTGQLAAYRDLDDDAPAPAGEPARHRHGRPYPPLAPRQTSRRSTRPPGGRCNLKTGYGCGSPGKFLPSPRTLRRRCSTICPQAAGTTKPWKTLGLRGELLAPIATSWETAGFLTPEVARHLDLKSGVPVAAGAGDTAAAMLGSGFLEVGRAQLTVGTGGQILVPVAHPEPDPHGRTPTSTARPRRGSSTPWAAVQNAGLALEWSRKVLGASWDEVYEEAFAVPPGAGGASFLPYLSGERTPHLDPEARGAWTGLGLGHTRGHLLRAALEGVAFGLREGVEALEAAGKGIPELRLAGGGTTKEPWRQLLADILARPLRLLPDDVAGTASARGAALLAGVANGAYESVEQTLALAPETRESVEPGPAGESYETAYLALQRTLSPTAALASRLRVRE